MKSLVSESRRKSFRTLQAVACVVLSASVGIAAGAVRLAPRAEAKPSPSERRPSPRQEIYPAAQDEPRCTSERSGDEPMLLVPGGTYRSFFKRDGKAAETRVMPFLVDRLPV